jgi:hypothetical protein
MAGMLFLFAASSLFRVFIIAWTVLDIVSNRFHENNSDLAIDEVWHPCPLTGPIEADAGRPTPLIAKPNLAAKPH